MWLGRTPLKPRATLRKPSRREETGFSGHVAWEPPDFPGRIRERMLYSYERLLLLSFIGVVKRQIVIRRRDGLRVQGSRPAIFVKPVLAILACMIPQY
jgi:hypothetical protein